MKKKTIIVIVIILILALLIPIPSTLLDGGTRVYKSIIYEVRKVHSLTTVEEMDKGKMYNEGIIIEIFGFEVFNNVK